MARQPPVCYYVLTVVSLELLRLGSRMDTAVMSCFGCGDACAVALACECGVVV